MCKIPAGNLVLIVLFAATAFNAAAQELGYSRIWSVQTGIMYSTVTSSGKHTELNADKFLLSEQIQKYKTKMGWQAGVGHFQRLNRYMGIQMALSFAQSRKSAQYQSNKVFNEVVETVDGAFLYNNIYFQSYAAPRLFFGQFKRFYLEIGPYLEWNILNLSSFNGSRVEYFEVTHDLGKPVLIELADPSESKLTHKAEIKQTDFGGAITIGTFLALPGQHMIQLELRYSRGAFLFTEFKGMRQNRFFFIVSYSLPHFKSHSIDLYLPYLIS